MCEVGGEYGDVLGFVFGCEFVDCDRCVEGIG